MTPAETQQDDGRAVGDVRPTSHELSAARSWAWTTSQPPATPQELADLISTALAHERERLAYLAARPSADTETLRRVRELLPRIEDLAEFEEGGDRLDAADSVRTVLKHLRAALDGER